MAAALEIPAVVGLGKFLDRAQHCRLAIIDGDEGLVILDPDPETQDRYHEIAAERSAWFQDLTRQADLPAETVDGTPIELWGNIEFGGEVLACLERGAKGVRLFRTEFLFLNAETPPSEDQQYEVYASVVGSMRGRPIIIRTLDLGADKLPAYQSTGPLESNPALGLRSLRLSLRDPGLFRPQLRRSCAPVRWVISGSFFRSYRPWPSCATRGPSLTTWPPNSGPKDMPSATT